MKNLIFIFLITFKFYPQNTIDINGIVIENTLTNDSIIFHKGPLSSDLYEQPKIKSYVKNNKFIINGAFNYPQMYYLSFFSENDKIPYRKEIFFIDNKTKFIKISNSQDTIIGNNNHSFEYYKKFIPFVTNKEEISFQKLRFSKPERFDTKLKEYILENNSSFVALWNLAERINNQGYKSIYNDILNSFSKKIKKSELWQKVYLDLNNIQIRENQKFPEKFILKDSLNNVIIFNLPKSKYILIDFWFSRCKPCLEKIPYLVEIFKKYESKQFNIVSISVDKTKDIDLWNKRIIEKQIPWINYLDENGVFSTIEKINSFPTNYLLDENGKVIKKNIELEELIKFLNENLNY